MSVSFLHLARCGDLSQTDLERAVASRENCSDLLARMSEVSAPGTGAASVLTLCAALASEACDWLDGDLVVDLVEEDDVTSVRVLTDLGSGMREKVFRQTFAFSVPLSEIQSAIDRMPSILGALKTRRVSWKRLSLVAAEEVRRSTMPPRVGVSDETTWMLDKIAGEKKRAAEIKRRSESPNTAVDVDDGWDDA